MKLLIAAALLCAGAGGAFAGDLPDPKLTPGVPEPSMTEAKLCAKGFSTKTVRNVSADLKKQVYASYHLTVGKKPCPCEVDHLVPLELGGSNDQKNLWPQSYVSQPLNAHVKDRLENRLHKLVCSGKVDLKTAQDQIRTNWIKARAIYMNTKGVKSNAR